MRRATRVIVQNHKHTWNFIYNAQSNMCHSRNSPNIALATKNKRPKSQRSLLKAAETSFTMRGRSEHDPTMKPSVRNPLRDQGYFSRPPRAFCVEKYKISRSGYHSKFHRMLRQPRNIRKISLQLYKCCAWHENGSHDCSLSQIKRYLKYTEEHASLSKLTK